MQKILLLLLLLAGTATVQAQSLKDMLYGGKLKSDSNTVVRKTDDLKAKMDTGQKKPVVAAEKATAAVPADSVKGVAIKNDSVAAATALNVNSADSAEIIDSVEAEAPVDAVAAVPAKSNTKLWKEYTDALVATLKPELQNAKKVKNGTYHVLVSYEIQTDGKVTANNVGITPANEMLHALIRQYVDSTPLQLGTTTDSAGQPRKVRRSGSFTITKD